MIALDGVTKSYRTEGRPKIVLDNVDMVFETGHSYALLGVNGAGKSTTLRVISGMELPNSGKIRRSARVSWPIGLASGFHYMMSGYDNVRFAARVYGEDTRRVVNFVQEFAEIGDYIHEPVKTYSSGMMARLAFGLSMAIAFDVYLVDEVTAVGDARFQKRCAEAFEVRRRTSDMIVVSHSMDTVAQYCDRGVLLVDGRLFPYATVGEAVAAYMRLNR